MTSETDYEGPGDGNLPDDAPEADVLEQRTGSAVTDDETGDGDLPNEADPADVEEQRHDVSDAGDEDDYR
ncbi:MULTISPECIES: hypothetical protein [Kribbella]|uniref:Uncharacterized protein n=1 Tax=Kribbella karoonensis TaxID=324851 RepID=A0ABN2DY36_9ACTN